MSKTAAKAAISTSVRFYEWRGLNCCHTASSAMHWAMARAELLRYSLFSHTVVREAENVLAGFCEHKAHKKTCNRFFNNDYMSFIIYIFISTFSQSDLLPELYFHMSRTH